MNLTAHQLQTVKDVLLLRLILERGGQWALTFEEIEAIGKEFDGYSVMMNGNQEGVVLKVQSPQVSA